MPSLEERNEREWANPENWGGWTFNLANTAGALWYTGLLLFAILVPALVLIFALPACRYAAGGAG